MAPLRTPVVARVVLVLLTLSVMVFLGVGLRGAKPQAEGRALATGNLDEQSSQRALGLVRDAQRMNPDSEADLLEGRLLLTAGSPREAAEVIEEVARREPENSTAWALLAGATREIDPARAREARAELRRLEPPVEP